MADVLVLRVNLLLKKSGLGLPSFVLKLDLYIIQIVMVVASLLNRTLTGRKT